MAKYLIQGGARLKGSIKISGNKNSILPCLAACLLTEDEVVIINVPDISDVGVFSQLLTSLGAEVERDGQEIKIKAKNVTGHKLDEVLTSKLRGSVLLAGALLGRVGEAEFCHPGGDVIGKRDIDIHLSGFEKLGFRVETSDLKYKIKNSHNADREVIFFLRVPSVTGTENLILASVLRKGQVILKNCAQEPHVVDLCKMLNKMGADIKGVGSSTLIINGVSKLNGVEFKICPDVTEIGTYMAAAAITRGEIEFIGIEKADIDPILWPLEQAGLEFKKKGDNLVCFCRDLTAVPVITSGFWPGFPTDLISVMIVLATQSKGISLLRDWIYESRMFFVDKLIMMGANITIADPHRVMVYGPTKLYARNLESPDIRAGMALVLAALVAKGTSTINNADLIERGYDMVVEKLSKLGAEIDRLE